jgi:hypothetical protein
MEKSEELLAELELRMEALTSLLVALRNEKESLSRKVTEGEEREALLKQENSDLSAKMEAFEAEKEKTVLKLETLLARFNDYGQ